MQQTLGIGLGFDYDHNTRLKRGETPTIHRLRSRAAKSAVKHVQQLYDPNTAKKQLEAVNDPKERARVAAEMRRNVQKEIDYLAESLLELTPTNAAPPEGMEAFDIRKQSDAVGLRTPIPLPDVADPQSLVPSQGRTPNPFEEFVRREYGEDAMNSFNQEEISIEDEVRQMYGTEGNETALEDESEEELSELYLT